MRKIDLVLREVSDKINPDKEVMDFMSATLKNFEDEINCRIKKFNLDVELFVGGSFAKNTLIKKEVYDIDLFLRFGNKYSEDELFTISKKILKNLKKFMLFMAHEIILKLL
jgi:tRNA nucleotidyltransferase (CCA-adding enzyme)